MMWFDSWGEFFQMGAYAFHVWTSWCLSIGAMLIIVIVAKRRNAKIKQVLARQYKREAKLSKSAPTDQ